MGKKHAQLKYIINYIEEQLADVNEKLRFLEKLANQEHSAN